MEETLIMSNSHYNKVAELQGKKPLLVKRMKQYIISLTQHMVLMESLSRLKDFL